MSTLHHPADHGADQVRLAAVRLSDYLDVRQRPRRNLWGFGGINAWKPENTTIDPARLPAPGKKLRPGSASFSKSFNDAWLVQETVGTKVAVDPGRRVWLGVTGRFITNFGPGKGRWAGFGPTAAFRFGR
jgi:hypothetical protein